MSPTPAGRLPAQYQFRIDGHLHARWSGWFDDFTIELEPDGTSTLTGPVRDQAQLHGLLSKIRDLGVTLIHVQVSSEPSGDSGET